MSGIKDRKRKRARKKRLKQIRILFGALILIIALLGIIFAIRGLSKTEKAPKVKKTETKKKGPDTSGVIVNKLVINTKSDSKKPVDITISSMGDCTLGTDVNFDQSKSLNAYYNAQGADYFFKNVRPVLEKDDVSIVNMEGTLTEAQQRAEKTYAFKAPPEYAAILSGSSVEAANLANNHSKDYGEESYTDTIKNLEDTGIATFGYERVEILEVKGVKVGLAGIYELADHLERKKQVKENIAALKEAGAQIIVVNFHWGAEREYTPNDTQKTLAHLAIDQGADLVIGHHPHVLQGVEKYKGKYIAYSLGNFCFGGNSNPQDKDTMIFQQTFTVTKDGVQKDAKLNMIPCSISSASGYNDYSPRILEGDEKQRVLDKIEEYSKDL